MIRKYEFIEAICDKAHAIDGNYEKFKEKLDVLVKNHDTINFTRQLLLQPNLVLSCIYTMKPRIIIEKPLLLNIGRSDNDKMFSMFVSCLIHFSLIVLNESNDERNILLSKYFNFNESASIINGNTFWGIKLRDVTKDSSKYKNIQTIMSQKCFDGLSNIGARDVCNTILCLLYSVQTLFG